MDHSEESDEFNDTAILEHTPKFSKSGRRLKVTEFLKREVQNIDQEINNSVAIPQLEEKVEKCSGIDDNKLTENFKDIIFGNTRIASSINNVDENDIIDKADFEEEEEELNDIINSNSITSSNSPNSEIISYSHDFPFKRILVDASPVKSTDENDIIVNDDFEVEDKELNDIFNSNSASPSNNPNFETGYFNEAFHFTPTPTVTSLDISTDENVNLMCVDSSQRKNVFKKMKSFFKKVVTHKRNDFSYRRF
ncbi:hypothetical protein TNCT_321881 [Trichonephila clavata]|uniref:Uncharacterized protein n=1 Tax=Trichonephila clavata TaxID=2740835 RepID=A0A8X6JZK0_TRICU|nr:hypothetical protein TNCT_321881 [Trichonephila clavata]